MRVVAGEAKGRRLKSVPGEGTRPILDRVKVALFDTLGNRVVGCHLLDLFAGTGGVGIEALSRGASHATFVENGHRALRVLRENLTLTGFADRATVLPMDVFHFLAGRQTKAFDLVFLAPPQYQGLVPKTLTALLSSAVLTEGSLVVAQQDPKEPVVSDLTRLLIVDQRRYGTTLLVFYETVLLDSR